MAQRDGLNDANFLDAHGQFMQCILVKFMAWLIGVSLYRCDGDLVDGRRSASGNVVCGYQRIESSPQGVALDVGVVFLAYRHSISCSCS